MIISSGRFCCTHSVNAFMSVTTADRMTLVRPTVPTLVPSGRVAETFSSGAREGSTTWRTSFTISAISSAITLATTARPALSLSSCVVTGPFAGASVLVDGDSCVACSAGAVGGARGVVEDERQTQVGAAVDHVFVADWSGGATVTGPLRLVHVDL